MITTHEKLVISAYTGVLMTEVGEFHEYAQNALQRPIQTFEMASVSFWEELREKVKDEFMELCKKPTECEWPEGVQMKIGGIEVEPHWYEETEVHENCTVTISKCKKCGKIDISWTEGDL